MPAFPKPKFDFNYKTNHEIAALRAYRDTEPGRQIPQKSANRLLIASWNIANLGLQKRRPRDYSLIAEIVGWFDVIAIQETNERLGGLESIIERLPNSYSMLFSDSSGNNERMAFIYDTNKVAELEMIGEVAVPVKDQSSIKLPGVPKKFVGFDRNPYFTAFSAGSFEFVLVNVHLYFGEDKLTDRRRRSLEAYAVSRWGDLRQRAKTSYVNDVIVLGDFNLPKVEAGDLIYEALRKRGLRRPEHSTRVASSIAKDKDYDQIMFFPGRTKKEFTGNIGVFDFDNAVFAGLWATRTLAQFRSYVRYYLSDHRPLWAEFKI